jgi:hypothetical protein
MRVAVLASPSDGMASAAVVNVTGVPCRLVVTVGHSVGSAANDAIACVADAAGNCISTSVTTGLPVAVPASATLTVAVAPAGSELSVGQPDSELSPTPFGAAAVLNWPGRSAGVSNAVLNIAWSGTTGGAGVGATDVGTTGGGATVDGAAGLVVGLGFGRVVVGRLVGGCVVVVAGGVVVVIGAVDVVTGTGVAGGAFVVVDRRSGPVERCGSGTLEQADTHTATVANPSSSRRMRTPSGRTCRDPRQTTLRPQHSPVDNSWIFFRHHNGNHGQAAMLTP